MCFRTLFRPAVLGPYDETKLKRHKTATRDFLTGIFMIMTHKIFPFSHTFGAIMVKQKVHDYIN